MKRTALVFGAIGGVLVAGLRLVEYRFLVVEHSLQIYGGLVAAVFSGVGLWLGITIAGRRHAAGLNNREIAERLFVSENTVKTHSGRLLDKLGAKRRTQAVQRARDEGLIA